MVRCKVACVTKQPFGNEGEQLYFSAVYSGSPENEKFFRYTPGGTVILNICRPEVSSKFTVGKEYYLDFSEAESHG